MTPEQAACEHRAEHGEACGSVCTRWPHRQDPTDRGLTWCSFCLACQGQPAGLCATMSTERSPFSHPPKPGGWGLCACGGVHTPPIAAPAAPNPYMGAVA